MRIYKYGQAEIEYLKQQDQLLGAAIERMGMVEREVFSDVFAALIHCVIAQQISAKAVATIWGRMQQRFDEITPQRITAASAAEIQQCGLSLRKAEYIKNLGQDVADGALKLAELYQLADAEVIKRLSALRGIGVWTAEMILLHALERPDVVSWGDIAIRRGMMNLYGLEALTQQQFAEYRKRYAPYGSVASIYLWKLSMEKISIGENKQ